MQTVIRIFKIGIKNMFRDGIIFMLLIAPILAGVAFRFGVPFANDLLENYFEFSLVPWYVVFDGMLLVLAPMLFGMASSFLLMDEKDESLGSYYRVVPGGRYGYMMARIGMPVTAGFLITIVLSMIFDISGLAFSVKLAGAFLSALGAGAVSMMVVCIAKNKVEGLAVSKLSGMTFLGLILVFFVPTPYVYFSAFLPSFWLGLIVKDGLSVFLVISGAVVSAFWLWFFTRLYIRKQQ